jgi:hypothetical protein
MIHYMPACAYFIEVPLPQKTVWMRMDEQASTGKKTWTEPAAT